MEIEKNRIQKMEREILVRNALGIWGFFSAVKRTFGEGIRAASGESMNQEVKMKGLFYSIFVHSV